MLLLYGTEHSQTNPMEKSPAQRHPDWFAMSVYEDPENLMPATNRILVVSVLVTLISNAGLGYGRTSTRTEQWKRASSRRWIGAGKICRLHKI